MTGFNADCVLGSCSLIAQCRIYSNLMFYLIPSVEPLPPMSPLPNLLYKVLNTKFTVVPFLYQLFWDQC